MAPKKRKEKMCAFHCPLQGIPFIDLQCRALHFTRHAALLNNNQSLLVKLHMPSPITFLLVLDLHHSSMKIKKINKKERGGGSCGQQPNTSVMLHSPATLSTSNTNNNNNVIALKCVNFTAQKVRASLYYCM